MKELDRQYPIWYTYYKIHDTVASLDDKTLMQYSDTLLSILPNVYMYWRKYYDLQSLAEININTPLEKLIIVRKLKTLKYMKFTYYLFQSLYVVVDSLKLRGLIPNTFKVPHHFQLFIAQMKIKNSRFCIIDTYVMIPVPNLTDYIDKETSLYHRDTNLIHWCYRKQLVDRWKDYIPYFNGTLASENQVRSYYPTLQWFDLFYQNNSNIGDF